MTIRPAFTVASVLALLAMVTLVIKTAVDLRASPRAASKTLAAGLDPKDPS